MISSQITGTASGILETPLAKVATLLLDVPAGHVSGQGLPLVIAGFAGSIEIQGGPEKFTVLTGDKSAQIRLCFIDVDRENFSISTYGGWWFRGEYKISNHEKGSLLTYNLSNAATGMSGIIAGFLHRRELSAARPTLEMMLQSLGKRLGCPAYVIE